MTGPIGEMYHRIGPCLFCLCLSVCVCLRLFVCACPCARSPFLADHVLRPTFSVDRGDAPTNGTLTPRPIVPSVTPTPTPAPWSPFGPTPTTTPPPAIEHRGWQSIHGSYKWVYIPGVLAMVGLFMMNTVDAKHLSGSLFTCLVPDCVSTRQCHFSRHTKSGTRQVTLGSIDTDQRGHGHSLPCADRQVCAARGVR